MVAIFVVQFWWLFACWLAIALLVVRPHAKRLPVEDQLALWIAPEMFRVLGLGLLQPNLAPGMPAEFAIATSIGDATTASLALAAFIALRKRWRPGRALAWAASMIGLGDILFAFPHALHSGAMQHLHAQYFVPVVAGPIMVVSHLLCLATLFRSRRGAAVSAHGAAQRGTI